MQNVTDTYTPEQVRAFRDLLVSARRRRGLSQTEVAEAVGVSQTFISGLERGPSSGMRVGELFRLLAYYGIEANTVSDVLGYTNTAKPADNPRTKELLDALSVIPDDAFDLILDALDLMVVGAQKDPH